MTGNAGRYGRVAAKKFGIVYSDDAVTDGADAVDAVIGQIIIDGTDGKVAYVDTNGKSQELS